MARLALNERSRLPGPHIRRVVVRERGAWAEPFVGVRGDVTESLCGVVEMDQRCFSWNFKAAQGHPELEAQAREAMWLDTVEDLAGPVAETRARGWSVGACWLMLGKGGDFRRARARLRLLGRVSDLQTAWDEAWVLVREHWPAVRAVAERLRERNELDGEEVEQMVQAVMPDRPRPFS